MTDAAAQQHSRLPVDASPPPERLNSSMLLAAAAAALLLHLALVAIFTPLAPEQNEGGEQAGHSALFVSSPDAAFLKMANIYDPVTFLHPPADVGFSFFQANRDDFALESSSTPVSVPQMFADLEPLPPFEFDPVAGPLSPFIAETDAFSDAEPAPVAVSCPYCVADSKPEVQFPALVLDTQAERMLRRSPPDRPSVFEIRPAAAEILSVASAPDVPFAKVILMESCGQEHSWLL